MGDSRGDYSVFRLAFEGIDHFKVFLGRLERDIQEALLFDNMIIPTDTLYHGGGKVLNMLPLIPGGNSELLHRILNRLGEMSNVRRNIRVLQAA